MNKKCWFYMIMIVVCVATLANTIFVMPTLFQEVGRVYSPPTTLNSLLLVGFFLFLTLYGLERHKLNCKIQPPKEKGSN